jgi:hypothetical protein
MGEQAALPSKSLVHNAFCEYSSEILAACLHFAESCPYFPK